MAREEEIINRRLTRAIRRTRRRREPRTALCHHHTYIQSHHVPGGPTKLVIEGSWFTLESKCEITGLNIVQPDASVYPKFAFLQTCYQGPVALWPKNPFNSRSKKLVALDYNFEKQ